MPKTKQKTREQEIRDMRAHHSTSAKKVRESVPLVPVKIDKVKDKKLVALFERLKKKYKGEEVVTTIASGSRASNISVVPSGWQEMDDLVTGETDADARTVPGSGLGWPRGRIMEIYGEESVGKTSTALQIIAAFQKAGEECAFVDAEHALDVRYAKKLGVNLERLKLVQPDSGGERAMDVVHDMSASGLFGCIVVDSVSALVPQSEIDADFEENGQPGRQAHLMSRALRKLTSVVARSNVLLIFINQIRIKIGVRFGNPKCLHQDTPIPFVDGTAHTIREIVDRKLIGPVWAFSERRGFYPSHIAEHHYNGEAADDGFTTVSSRGPGNQSGVFSATVSPTHKFLTSKGWRHASELTTSDRLVTKFENRINGTAADFFRGMMCGDVHLKVRSRISASIKLQDKKDPKYLAWKRNLCTPWLGEFRATRAKSGTPHETAETFDILNAAAPFGGQRDPMGMLRRFSWMGMAVWVMDDGHFDHKSHQRYILSIKRLRNDVLKQQEISAVLDELGLDHHWSKAGSITFTVSASNALARGIAPFVPPIMRRKLPDSVAKEVAYAPFKLSFETRLEKTLVDILSVDQASKRKYRNRGYYDISVPDGHDYLAGGVGNGFVVHNTTSGGQALKFYASIRLELTNMKTMRKGDRVTGRRIRVRTVKNKVAPPFRDVYVDLVPNKGIAAVYGDPDFGGKGSDADDDK